MTTEQIAYNEEPLVGMVPKTLSEMSESELRDFVQDVQNTRATMQTLRARMAISRAVKAEAQEQKKVDATFADF